MLALRRTYGRYVADDHEGARLGEQVGEVDERGAVLRPARQHQQLRPVVLHVLASARQAVRARQRCLVHLRLRAAAPVHV